MRGNTIRRARVTVETQTRENIVSCSVGRYHRSCATVTTVKKIPRYSVVPYSVVPPVVPWRYFRYYLNRQACRNRRKI